MCRRIVFVVISSEISKSKPKSIFISSIAFFQVQRQLDRVNGLYLLVTFLFSRTKLPPNYIPVQIQIRTERIIIIPWRRWNTHRSRELKEINSLSRCCEYPRGWWTTNHALDVWNRICQMYFMNSKKAGENREFVFRRKPLLVMYLLISD
jgi:hypothetical protein